jgi:signal transduction histidine kinase
LHSVFKDISRDAAAACRAVLAHLVRLEERDGQWVPGRSTVDGPGLARGDAAAAILALLEAGPFPAEAAAVVAGSADRCVLPTGAPLAALLGGAGLHSVFLEVGAPGPITLLHLVLPGPPDPETLLAVEAVARLVASRLASIELRRELTRDRLTLLDLRRTLETLAGLQQAGTQLMIEADEGSILGAISRELTRLGLHSGVLLDAPEGDADRPVLHWRYTSIPDAQRLALERVLDRPMAGVRLDRESAPLAWRSLEDGRTVVASRPRALARELVGGATAAQLRALTRVIGDVRIVVAPVRREGQTIGLLVVLAPRLRAGDLEAIEAFASQASIALEKARLVGALRVERARLNAEVDRRTRDLRLAIEALQETDRKKDNFLANVSHELRTPLVTVLGWAELLAGDKLGPLAPRQRQGVQVIRSSARRLETFIGELLDFSRHELTRDRLNLRAVAAGEVLAAAVIGMAPRFAERGLRVRARPTRGLPCLWADRERLLQVLVNLLSNAERHSATGGAIRVAAARGRDGQVEISVSDDGEGIADEHLARVFDRLYQVRDTAAQRERGPGLGLGLAIARSIVEAHGGRISVRSRVGRGTTFRFSVPTAKVAEPA